MQDIRKERQKNLIAWKKFQLNILKFRFWIIKKKWWILLFLVFSLLCLFPEESGSIIGNWINLFFGSIFKSSGLIGLIIFFILIFLFPIFVNKKKKST